LRVSFAGELGWELHCPAERASDLFSALAQADGVVPAGYFALLNSLRVEKGFVHYGGEITPAETPLEAGLGFACKLKAGQPDFVGKAAILSQRSKGWRKRLVSVQVNQGADVSLFGHDEELIYRDGLLVGALTSGGYSHTLECAIGLGFVHGPSKVPQDWLGAGTYELEVPVRNTEGCVELRRFPATVSTKCLVDPRGDRVRGTYS
jgi:4-methylaminobutanoate oxidase (formaldehyde-forming)